MSTVKIKNLSKSYGNNEILKGINLDIKSGEFIVLVGPSGCGKSTTLRLIAGLEEANNGEIFIDDVLINDMDPSKRDIAMVFQNYALYPQMTVRENMSFGLRIRKISDSEINKRVVEASHILKINELLDRKPKELSGGQRQRVALGRAIVRKPKVFLFDEPLSNLDAKLRQEMRVEIKKLHKMLNTTMVYVTHDQVEAMTMGDRIVVMNNGMIEQVGHPDEIYTKPLNMFVSSFIGSPQINLIKGELKKDKSNWVFLSDDFKLLIDDNHYQYSSLKEGAAVLGIRSEDISEKQSGNNNIEARVDISEYLGSETNIYCSLASNSFIAKFNKRFNAKKSDPISVFFNVNKGHFFDLKNEELL